MQYFKILNMSREPFSNSPEPEFFYQSSQHLGCLQQLELAIRLRRGLNIVMGNVGTGKTTLCRELILRFTEREDDRNEIETYLVLDPSFSTPREFLALVALTFGLSVAGGESDWQIKESIKNHLFRKGVDEKKNMVLIIDEGQKLPAFGREILREFLNYETNENKLLQIVIFAQNEFRDILKEHVNFADRVNQYYLLEPLSFRETMAMIRFRMVRAGRPADAPLFTICGLWEIYRATGGYPRRIITLCHQILLALIIQNKLKAGLFLVRSVSRRLAQETVRKGRWAVVGLNIVLLLSFVAFLVIMLNPMNILRQLPPADPALNAQAKSSLPVKPAAPAVNPVAVEKSSAPAQEVVKMTTSVVAKQETSPPKPAREVNVPSRLGSLRIQEGGTVYRLLLEIYGKMGTDRFRAVVRANPQIANMNLVRTGELIAFPAVPVAGAPWPQNGKRVRIALKGNLNDAYGFYKEYPAYIKMLPLWTPRDGLVFALVLRKIFDSDAEAQSAIGKLPAALAVNAQIMEKPGTDAVFFAN